jgi:hypothetical protein
MNVLFLVGSVNLNRIENFERTRKHSKADYVPLLRGIDKFEPLYTLAHVMAEVSNLSDLTGRERIQARQTLKSLLGHPARACHAKSSGGAKQLL